MLGGPWESPAWQVPTAPCFPLQLHACIHCLCKAPGDHEAPEPLTRPAGTHTASRLRGSSPSWPIRADPLVFRTPKRTQTFVAREQEILQSWKLTEAEERRPYLRATGQAPFSGKVGKPHQWPELCYFCHTSLNLNTKPPVFRSHTGPLGHRQS